jgi:hydroxyacylglutathione hydrolase
MMQQNQWVCIACGYNMIGEMPDVCPFCGARHDQFLGWEVAGGTYRVTPVPVNDYVTLLLSGTETGYRTQLIEWKRMRVPYGLTALLY